MQLSYLQSWAKLSRAQLPDESHIVIATFCRLEEKGKAHRIKNAVGEPQHESVPTSGLIADCRIHYLRCRNAQFLLTGD